MRFLAVAAEERRELIGIEGREELGGGHAAAGIEAHVERATGTEAEPTVASASW